MLYLRYDKYQGIPFRDGEVEIFVSELVEQIHTQDIWLSHSTDNILYAIRVAITDGRMAASDVVFEYSPYTPDMISLPIVTLASSNRGAIDSWPAGYCDTTEQYLLRLLEVGATT